MEETFSAQTSLTINAPIEKVWQALVDPVIVKQYLHGTDLKTDWNIGAPITWSGDWNGKAYEDKGIVLKYTPPSLVSTSHWSPLSGTEDTSENYHIVTYTLSEHDSKTTLTLTQSNSPTQEDADSMIENGWRPILQTLKDLLENKT